MKDNTLSLSELETLIKYREEEISSLRDDVSAFLCTKHTIKETAKALLLARKVEIEIKDISRSIPKNRNALSDVKTKEEKLCQRCLDLKRETRELQTDLVADLAALRQENLLAFAKLTFFFGLPFTFLMIAKNGLPDGMVSANQAVTAGFIISSTVLYKDIMETFEAAGKSICGAPKKMGNNPALSLILKTSKEKGGATKNRFKEAAKTVHTKISGIPTRAKEFVVNTLNKKPKP